MKLINRWKRIRNVAKSPERKRRRTHDMQGSFFRYRLARRIPLGILRTAIRKEMQRREFI